MIRMIGEHISCSTYVIWLRAALIIIGLIGEDREVPEELEESESDSELDDDDVLLLEEESDADVEVLSGIDGEATDFVV